MAIETPDERAARVQKELDSGEKRWRNPKTRADMEEGQRAREELYAKNAPTGAELDRLEMRAKLGDIRGLRQLSPGVYAWVQNGGEWISTGARR